MLLTLESKSYKSRECALGLYYYDTVNPEICDKVELNEVENKYKTPVNDYSRLQTVKNNKCF